MTAIEMPVDSLSVLKRVKFYITSNGTPDTPYSLTLYRFLPEAGPERPVLNMEIKNTASYGNEWSRHDLKSEKITLEPGKYLIPMKWMASPGQEGLTTQTIGFRESVEEPPVLPFCRPGKEPPEYPG